jgi:hypothetical protein
MIYLTCSSAKWAEEVEEALTICCSEVVVVLANLTEEINLKEICKVVVNHLEIFLI